MSEEPDNLVLHLLREMRVEMATKADLAKLENDIADVRSDVHSLRADVASDLIGVNARIDATRKELGEQIVGLRRAVIEYHSTIVGHGVLFSQIEDRVRRIEDRLGMSATEAH